MRIKVSVPEEQVDPVVINAALEAVTALDEKMIASGQSPTADEAAAMGAIWRPEPPGDECFDHGGTIAARGWGDCDDWAPLGAATLRTSGEDPGARAVVIPSGPMTYHAVVQRSDGSLEDPSVMAGMRPLNSDYLTQGRAVVGGQAEGMQVWACDPHDQRIYTGSLLPTTGPLSVHCGVGIAVRGVVLPDGPYYEARVDTPIQGSKLVKVRAYHRRAPRHHRGRGHRSHGYDVAGGVVPYSIACIGHGWSAQEALVNALQGAICCGDASGFDTSLDRYKNLSLQAGLMGLTPGQTRELLREQLSADLQNKAAATGQDPLTISRALIAELEGTGMHVQGATTWVVGDFFSDIANAASGVVSSVSSAVNSVAQAAGSIPWGDIIHDAEAVVSAVPGIGTAVSDVVAAAETAYDAAADLLGGHPLDAAIDAAYNFAMGTVPGADSLRGILDPIVSSLKKLADGGEPPGADALNAILAAVPTSPSFGSINPQSVASSIAKLITSHMGVDSTKSSAPKSLANIVSPAQLAALAKSQQRTPANLVSPAQLAALAKAQHAQTSAAIKAPLSAAQATKAWRAQASATAKPLPPGAARPAAPGAAARPSKPRPAPPVLHPVARAVLAAKPPGIAHAGLHVDDAARPLSPGAPPGATHWTCMQTQDGTWSCRWL